MPKLTDPNAQILENTGSVTVWAKSNGQITAEENGPYTPIKDMGH